MNAINSKFKMETSPQGIVYLKCNHVVSFEAAKGSKTTPNEEAAPISAGIELAPGGVLYLCCAWCAAHVRENALKALVEQGFKVTIEKTKLQPSPLAKNMSEIGLEAEIKAAHSAGNWKRCQCWDTAQKLKCLRPAGHAGDHLYEKQP